MLDIRADLKDGDVLTQCVQFEAKAWTEIGPLPTVEFRGGNFSNCARPAGVEGWDTLNRVQYEIVPPEIVVDEDGNEIGIEEQEPIILGVS